ncbi:hypothetical protein CRG98_035493 [Punica granatum]|uniref:Uncharacterized protein n=1 Tax=Punica granatum TaxID=22663 RepID=A0A2I0IJE0_PUNGR|nr:hypothetical protein CRG98_035493 [Punica granatum]
MATSPRQTPRSRLLVAFESVGDLLVVMATGSSWLVWSRSSQGLMDQFDLFLLLDLALAERDHYKNE